MHASADPSLGELAAAVASPDPSTGASYASAVPAALAAALVAKAARQTAASDPFGALAEDMEAVALGADNLREELLATLGDAIAAFERVISARREARPDDVQAAYRAALEPPLDVCRLSLRVLTLAEDVAERGHPYVAPAASSAALLAAAALETAAVNAEFDLRAIDDERFLQDRLEELAQARNEAYALRTAAIVHG